MGEDYLVDDLSYMLVASSHKLLVLLISSGNGNANSCYERIIPTARMTITIIVVNK